MSIPFEKYLKKLYEHIVKSINCKIYLVKLDLYDIIIRVVYCVWRTAMKNKLIKNKLVLLIFAMVVLTLGFIYFCNRGIEDVKAEKLVNEFIDTFKSCDYEKLYTLTNDGAEYYSGIYLPEEKTNELLFNFFSENLECKIKDVTQFDDKTVIVKTQLKNVKAEALMDRIQNQYLAYCQANEDILDTLDLDDLLYKVMEYEMSKNDFEKEVRDTDFTLVFENGSWKLESGIIIYDDMTGGYITYYYKNNIFNGLDVE